MIIPRNYARSHNGMPYVRMGRVGIFCNFVTIQEKNLYRGIKNCTEQRHFVAHVKWNGRKHQRQYIVLTRNERKYKQSRWL